MPVFSVRHRTVYTYRRAVAFGEHRLLFRPRDSFDQRLLSAQLRIDPEPGGVRWVHDVFGNCVALADVSRRSDRLCLETEIRLDHSLQTAPAFATEEHALTYPFTYGRDETLDLAPLIRRHYPDSGQVERWARRFLRSGAPTNTGTLLMTLCCAIQESFAYSRRSAPGIQAPHETLDLKRGTCRDYALLMMEAVRALGLAARFVTGYIYVPDRDGSRTLGGGSTHAWCQVYLPGAGWVEFDPTNGIVGNRDLIRVAVARDPAQAVPLSGTFDGEADDFLDMIVQVNVTTEPGDNDSDEAGRDGRPAARAGGRR